MTTLVFSIDIKPGVDMLEQIRQMTDDAFYHFCQDNAAFNFERDVTGTIKPTGQTGGETGHRNSELRPSPRVLSIRSSDQVTDEGVLPTPAKNAWVSRLRPYRPVAQRLQGLMVSEESLYTS